MNYNSCGSFSSTLPDSVKNYLAGDHIDLYVLNTPKSCLSEEALQKIYDDQLKAFMHQHPELVKNGTYEVNIDIAKDYFSGKDLKDGDSPFHTTIKVQRLKERKVKGADNSKTPKNMTFHGDLKARCRSILLQKMSFLSDAILCGTATMRAHIEGLNQFSVATYYRWRKDFAGWISKNPGVLSILSSIRGKNIISWHDAAYEYHFCPRMLTIGKDKKKEYFACIASYGAFQNNVK